HPRHRRRQAEPARRHDELLRDHGPRDHRDRHRQESELERVRAQLDVPRVGAVPAERAVERKARDLLTATRSSINETLAPIYGVAWPPAGAQLDADGFATVDLPSTRS